MESGASSSVEIRLLGPIELRVDGDDVAIGGARQRRLLALLSIRAGQVVPGDELVEDVWAGDPTEGAETTLRSYVSRLRRALGGAASIDRTDRGYVLSLEPASIDMHVFERLVREGGAALSQGAPKPARQRLGEALELWRGRPFGEVGNDGALAAVAERLGEVWLLAIEQRVEADLALGHAAELVDELERLVRAHPFRERLWHDLMLALYRSGRQADALAAYHRARAALDEELGIEPSEELQALEAAILRHDVAPARGSTTPNNLAAPLSTFVGRTQELAAIAGLLGRHRLVTLTGVGGVGKTRLATEAARAALDVHADGVFLVDLAPIVDAAHVTSAIAAALEVQEQARQSPTEALVAFLKPRDIVLVLDNCEHLADSVATLVRRLLEGSPRLRVLATSREVLGIAGEADFAVPPLGLPASDDEAAARSSEAVQLFLERAREARPDIGADDALVSLAARICMDLDGLPLALELAAARARALSLADIGRHLNDRFQFLVSWRRISSARHRTLREAMDWSYALLAPGERELLARVSVFPAGFTFEAAHAISGRDEATTLDALQRLVEASLVSVDTSANPTRYRLLETVRQYAAEKLGDECLAAERALTCWVFQMVTSIVPDSTKPLPGSAYERFDGELDNIRAALRQAATEDDPTTELTLGSLLWRYWWVRGLLREGRAGLEDTIRRRGVIATVAGARTHRGAASLAWAMGDLDPAEAIARQALDIAERIPDATEQLSALNVLGVISRSREDHAAAEAHFQRAIDLATGEGNAELVSMYSGNLGTVYLDTGRFADARALFQRVLEYRAPQGRSEHSSVAHLNLGQVELGDGKLEQAKEHFEEALEGFRGVGFKGRWANAMQGLAAVKARTGDPEGAARTLGEAAALIGETGWAVNDSPLERAGVEAARAALGDEAFERLFNEGLRKP